ncbi:MAG: DUF3568 family protein [Planctomycetes bacterium]|nr:DUF3568 family protein [Planctomycetota bacterium]
MRTKHVVVPLLLVAVLLLLQGCMAIALVGVGAGTVMYVKGDLEANLSNDINSVYQAAQLSIEQLDLKVSSKVKDALAAKIVARDAQDKKITIKLKSTAENTTELSIRAGVFGDETKSRLIYEQLLKNLNR